MLSIACVGSFLGSVIHIRRELAAGEIGVPATVRIVAGESVLELLQRADQADGTDGFSTVAERQFARAALAQGAMILVESFSPRDAPTWSRETPISTKGLELALPTDLNDCQRAAR